MTNDNPPGSEWRQSPGKTGMAAGLVMAIRFYSRLPVSGPSDAPNLDRMAAMVPAAGFLIGLGPAIVLGLATILGVPSLFAAALALVVWLGVTGAMAEDGLADAMDGLFGGSAPERRLEIMHDPRHGTYGVSALVLGLLLRASGLATLAFLNPVTGPLAWLGLTVVARSFSLWLPATLKPARADGASASAGKLSMPRFAAGAGVAAVLFAIAVVPILGVAGAAIALAVLALTVLAWRAACHLLVGGQTGDLIGSGQLLLEIAGLSFFMLWVG